MPRQLRFTLCLSSDKASSVSASDNSDAAASSLTDTGRAAANIKLPTKLLAVYRHAGSSLRATKISPKRDLPNLILPWRHPAVLSGH